MQEASINSQEEQGALLLNKAVKIKAGKHTYRIRPMKKYTNWRISYHLVSQKKVNPDIAATVGAMRYYQIEQAKVLSLAILNNYWSILLFHWIYWRVLLRRLSEQEYTILLSEVVQRMDAGFFLHNIEIAERINSLTRKRTQEEVLVFPVEQRPD
ncbi:MAG: hypothetical protein E6772_16245 [Dysgonomonas sp.]|nr:hypothetical protein [Dysgonomonas sp.]